MSLTRSTELVLCTVTTKAQKEKNFRPLGNPIGSAKQSCSISRVCVLLHATLCRCKKCLPKPNLHTQTNTHIHTQCKESRRERLRHVYGLNRAEQTLATTAEFPTPPDHFQLPGIFRFSDLFPPFLTFPKRKRACF